VIRPLAEGTPDRRRGAHHALSTPAVAATITAPSLDNPATGPANREMARWVRLLAGLVGERLAHRELDILLEQETFRGQLPGGRTQLRLAGCG
jgi:hypothetical protein